MTTESCATCEYGLPLTDNDVVQCRRFPPTLLLIEGKINAYQPCCNSNAWCGEFVDKSEKFNECNAEMIYLDWDCVYVSKDEAKKYVLDYGR